ADKVAPALKSDEVEAYLAGLVPPTADKP
ncbi:MAG: hypothetical protein ACI9TA_003171, partial [Reinekea sp.]